MSYCTLGFFAEAVSRLIVRVVDFGKHLIALEAQRLYIFPVFAF